MATRIPALIQLSDPRVAAQLVCKTIWHGNHCIKLTAPDDLCVPLPILSLSGIDRCDDVDNGLDNTCEVIRQETVLFSTPETDYIMTRGQLGP